MSRKEEKPDDNGVGSGGIQGRNGQTFLLYPRVKLAQLTIEDDRIRSLLLLVLVNERVCSDLFPIQPLHEAAVFDLFQD